MSRIEVLLLARVLLGKVRARQNKESKRADSELSGTQTPCHAAYPMKTSLTDVPTEPLPDDDKLGDTAAVQLDPLPPLVQEGRDGGLFWHKGDSLDSAEGIFNSVGISLVLWGLLLWMILSA